MRLLVALILVWLFGSTAMVVGTYARPMEKGDHFAKPFREAYLPVDASSQAKALGPGINVIIGHRGFEFSYFENIRKIGYRSVRLPLFAFDKMDKDGKLDPEWLGSLDRAVKAARDAGLLVILDEHDSDACSKDLAMCQNKLPKLWRSLSSHFRGASNGIIFEILNEPHGALNAESWNKLSLKVLKIIRRENPERNVVIGTTQWSAVETLGSLELPRDAHLIVSVHYYSPFRFTHARDRGGDVGSLPPVRFQGTREDMQKIQTDFEQIQSWRKRTGRPVILGEFGVCNRCGSREDRQRWVSMVSNAARQRNIPHIYWSFDGPFGVFEFSLEKWEKAIVAAQMKGGAYPAGE